ncbi:MAG: 16S rRNA (cytidine(1402)-2'-O)-methyltransferase, partial [Candidatus Limnocylindrales bacterium]
VCRELTKLHEQVLRLPLGELADAVEAGAVPERGEAVIVLGWGVGLDLPAVARVSGSGDLAAALERVEALVESGLARGEAARRVAAETGIARRALYRVAPGD